MKTFEEFCKEKYGTGWVKDLNKKAEEFAAYRYTTPNQCPAQMAFRCRSCLAY